MVAGVCHPVLLHTLPVYLPRISSGTRLRQAKKINTQLRAFTWQKNTKYPILAKSDIKNSTVGFPGALNLMVQFSIRFLYF